MSDCSVEQEISILYPQKTPGEKKQKKYKRHQISESDSDISDISSRSSTICDTKRKRKRKIVVSDSDSNIGPTTSYSTRPNILDKNTLDLLRNRDQFLIQNHDINDKIAKAKLSITRFIFYISYNKYSYNLYFWLGYAFDWGVGH